MRPRPAHRSPTASPLRRKNFGSRTKNVSAKISFSLENPSCRGAHTVIRNFVRTSTEGDPLSIDNIIKYTVSTFVTRCKVALNTATRQTLKVASRGGDPPVLYPKISRLLEPLAELSRDPKESIPTLSWSYQLHKTLVDHDLVHVFGSVDPVVFSEPGD